MNGLKLLMIEYDGIYGTIDGYTSESNVMNYLTQLKQGIEELDFDIVVYSLDALIRWYAENINKIRSNDFVFNFDSHVKNQNILKEIKDKIKKEDFAKTKTQGTSTASSKKLIFISHRTSDKKYGDALRDFLVGLGIQNNQLIYTSHPLHKIPMDANIYDYLRENINSEIFMIILWSNEYLESPACLNEMGAAWVTQSDYTNIYVPSFSFGNPKYHECAVDTRKLGLVLNGDRHCKANIIQLKNKVQELFKLKKDEANDTYLIDDFIEKIKSKKGDTYAKK